MEQITVGSISAELVEQSRGLYELAQAYEIVSPEMRAAASDDLKRIKALYKSVDEQEKSITRPINEGLKRVREMFAVPKGWLSGAEDKLKRAALTWDQAEEQKRAKAAAEAARIAAAERIKLADEAAREAATGNTEAAAAIMEAAAMVAPVPVTVAPKLAGESHREVWSAEITDIVAMCKGVADGTIPPEAVAPNMTFWNSMARSYKSAFGFPGVKAVCKTILASRTA